jgi:hypothetical protein
MARAVMSIEARERKAVWEGIGIVGDLARVKSECRLIFVADASSSPRGVDVVSHAFPLD